MTGLRETRLGGDDTSTNHKEGEASKEIDEQLRRGFVSRISMPFLLLPGDILVSDENGVIRGRMVLGRPQPVEFGEGIDKECDQEGTSKKSATWRVPCQSLEYSGAFYLVDEEVKIVLKTELPDDEVDIAALGVKPLKHAAHDVEETLKLRAKMWWKLRSRQLVSYDGAVPGGTEAVVDLRVDQIREVVWNDKAFESLLVAEDMKEQILALVTTQFETEKNTDFINNKGNGLTILLHGPAGTGKTFTAESVAEVARKPLYTVACSEIGTEPEQVQKYLQSVLHLGKIWDCIVLLDDAEVFLEQRKLQDPKRDALVSVFLHALEYYEGILILTTNRVFTVDAASKSHIRLTVHYQLDDYQRKQIWRHFLNRLKEIGEGDKIDFDDIEMNLDGLAQYPMNGWQIRNSITMKEEGPAARDLPRRLSSIATSHSTSFYSTGGCVALPQNENKSSSSQEHSKYRTHSFPYCYTVATSAINTTWLHLTPLSILLNMTCPLFKTTPAPPSTLTQARHRRFITWEASRSSYIREDYHRVLHQDLSQLRFVSCRALPKCNTVFQARAF
ncbi:hypothetical protein CEP54_014780 [Fusarium duplospermum]|uniref:AAA+ ATPase domain-containing protein n=1 Tax=Fusarium duplospermum TaxID=1325734 RepID=A0A428NTR7_9HYPO|nr:hypothetical protein CEP54_014780 [Fusarium duplospermum]